MTRLTLCVPAVAMLHALGACGPAVAQQATPVVGTIAVADDAPVSGALARVTPAQAQAAALAMYPGAGVSEVDLDEEDGFLVYEVDLWADGRETEVTVDAGTGEVLRVLQDRD